MIPEGYPCIPLIYRQKAVPRPLKPFAILTRSSGSRVFACEIKWPNFGTRLLKDQQLNRHRALTPLQKALSFEKTASQMDGNRRH
jgi:hypothetical protein